MNQWHIDYFSGVVIDLPKKQRTPENVLACLSKHPMVSTFDMSDNRWLCKIIYAMVKCGWLKDKTEDVGYPWHHFEVTEEGRRHIANEGELTWKPHSLTCPYPRAPCPTYPLIPGSRPTVTSRKAARQAKTRSKVAQEQILALLAALGPLTADECAELLGYRILFMRPRMSELKKMGKVIESGITRMSSEGNHMACFRKVGE